MSSLKFKRIGVLMLAGAAFAMACGSGGESGGGSGEESIVEDRAGGLSPEAEQELRDAGVDKYLGEFTPAQSTEIEGGWTKHTYAIDSNNGPICISGTPYSVFTRPGVSSEKLLIFEEAFRVGPLRS